MLQSQTSTIPHSFQGWNSWHCFPNSARTQSWNTKIEIYLWHGWTGQWQTASSVSRYITRRKVWRLWYPSWWYGQRQWCLNDCFKVSDGNVTGNVCVQLWWEHRLETMMAFVCSLDDILAAWVSCSLPEGNCCSGSNLWLTDWKENKTRNNEKVKPIHTNRASPYKYNSKKRQSTRLLSSRRVILWARICPKITLMLSKW